ncbi:MAG: glycosyltransferase family 2 protein, partial [Bacteroidaceae bacterium]|nr:glycosyltransferase family 2 protein [Bacteroidaceae bacterium]
PVMCIRWFLDMVAAMQFLMKSEWGNVCAVFRARRDYRAMRPSYFSIRKENMTHAIQPLQPERVRWSLLWRYYAKNKRRYSDL